MTVEWLFFLALAGYGVLAITYWLAYELGREDENDQPNHTHPP